MPSGKEAMRKWRMENPERYRAIQERSRAKQKAKRKQDRLNAPPRPPRHYQGQEPPARYAKVGCFVFDCVKWFVSLADNENDWYAVKVWADGSAPKKANYWLGYSGSRFAKVRDLIVMQERMPGQLDRVKAIVDDAIEGGLV